MELSHRTRFPGEYADGQTALLREVVVLVRFDHLSLREGDVELARWPLGSLTVERLPGGQQLRVVSAEAPGAVLTSRDLELETSLRGERVKVNDDGARRDARGVRRGLFFGAASLALLGLGYWSLPMVSRAIAFLVPVSVEAKLGGELELLFGDAYCATDEGTEALQALRDRLSPTSLGDVRVLNLSMPNAFALPGGKIVLTRGLLEEAEGPDEIAGVLAHEIQHSEQRHILAQLVRRSISTAAWAVTLGDYSGLLVVDPGTAFAITNLRFSRADEAEADRGAVAMLARANVSSQGFSDFFERIASKTDRVPEWLSSHPLSADRAKAAANGAPGSTTPALPSEQWEALRDICVDAPRPKSGIGKLLGD